MAGAELQVGAPPRPVRLAGLLVGLQGLAGVTMAVAILVGALGADGPVGYLVAEAGFFLLIGGAVTAAGWGLFRGRRGARTPAIVTQLLLLPVVYSLLGPSEQRVLGMLTLLYVVGTFMLLIGERSRTWSMGGPDQPPEGRS